MNGVSGWWLRLRRWLGVAAPADGLCRWKTWERTTTTSYSGIRVSTRYFKCVKTWGHGEDHDAPAICEAEAT